MPIDISAIRKLLVEWANEIPLDLPRLRKRYEDAVRVIGELANDCESLLDWKRRASIVLGALPKPQLGSELLDGNSLHIELDDQASRARLAYHGDECTIDGQAYQLLRFLVWLTDSSFTNPMGLEQSTHDNDWTFHWSWGFYIMEEWQHGESKRKADNVQVISSRLKGHVQNLVQRSMPSRILEQFLSNRQGIFSVWFGVKANLPPIEATLKWGNLEAGFDRPDEWPDGLRDAEVTRCAKAETALRAQLRTDNTWKEAGAQAACEQILRYKEWLGAEQAIRDVDFVKRVRELVSALATTSDPLRVTQVGESIKVSTEMDERTGKPRERPEQPIGTEQMKLKWIDDLTELGQELQPVLDGIRRDIPSTDKPIADLPDLLMRALFESCRQLASPALAWRTREQAEGMFRLAILTNLAKNTISTRDQAEARDQVLTCLEQEAKLADNEWNNLLRPDRWRSIFMDAITLTRPDTWMTPDDGLSSIVVLPMLGILRGEKVPERAHDRAADIVFHAVYPECRRGLDREGQASLHLALASAPADLGDYPRLRLHLARKLGLTVRRLTGVR